MEEILPVICCLSILWIYDNAYQRHTWFSKLARSNVLFVISVHGKNIYKRRATMQAAVQRPSSIHGGAHLLKIKSLEGH